MITRPPPGETTRDSLLDAGQQIFADKGFAGSSVREITGLAGANLAAITYHFGSKAGLFEAVLIRAQERMIETLEAAAWSPGNSMERLIAVVRAHFTFLADHPELRGLITRVLLSEGAMPEAVAANIRRVIGLIAGLVSRGQSEGVFREGDPRLLTVAVMAQPMMLNLLRGPLRAGPQIDLTNPAVREEALDNAVRFIRAGLGRSAPREG